jgi:hypothetical protein
MDELNPVGIGKRTGVLVNIHPHTHMDVQYTGRKDLKKGEEEIRNSNDIEIF